MKQKKDRELIRIHLTDESDRYGLNFEDVLDCLAQCVGIPVGHRKSIQNHIILYCKNKFGVGISKKQIKCLYHPYKDKFQAKAGIILMAIYNSLKNHVETGGDQRAIRIRENGFVSTPGCSANVIHYFYENIPDIIIQEREQLEGQAGESGNWNRVLINYLAHTLTTIENRLGETSWPEIVKKRFPFASFDKLEMPEMELGNREYLKDI